MSLFTGRLYASDHPSNSVQHAQDSSPSIFTHAALHSNPSPRPSQSSYPESKVDQLNCCWALLSVDLQFIYLDPVLQLHLEEQANLVVGKSLLQFIHPDEQATAQRDLCAALQSKTLHGSITRVRFARLSHIRREVGHHGPPSFPSIDFDSDYMTADILINLAAEGLVLCFIHATIKNNEPSWTNACNTPVVAQEQLQNLSRSLLMCAPESSHGRVFQILANTSARPSLISWPPFQDDSTDKDITELVKSVDLSSSSSSAAQAKTNCARRFKALRNLHGTEVESVYIPHGSVIFACHKLQTSSSPSSAVHSQSATSNTTDATSISSNSSVSFMGYNGSSSTSYSLPPPSSHEQSLYDQQYSLPPLSSTTISSPNYSFSSAQPTLPASSQYSYNYWNSPSSHHSVQNFRSGYWNHGSASYENGSSIPPPSLPLSGGHQSHGNYGRPLSPYSSHAPYSSNNHLNESIGDTSSTSSAADLVPPPKRRVSPGSSREYREGNGRERNHGNRPPGLLKCSSCKTTTSPEWRKGPSGKKELCNACGLRYARSRAKKEGHAVSNSGRKRKDKVIKRESSTPPSASSTAGSVTSSYSSSGVVPYHSSSSPSYASVGSLRRTYPNYDDVRFSSSSDIYGATRSAGKPSPSPPAGANAPTGGYTHYVSTPSDSVPHHHQSRTSYYGSSIPSPLVANPPMLQAQSFERDHRDREGLPPTPVSAEPRVSYYEHSYDRGEHKDPPRGYEREYSERGYNERGGRARSLVTG